jgi:hypothetical protein
METYQITAIRNAFKRFTWLQELLSLEDDAIDYLALETGIPLDYLKQNLELIKDL